MNLHLTKYAFAAGIRFDSFDSPVCDKQEYLQTYIQLFFTELVKDLPPKTAAILQVAGDKYGLK